MGDRIIYIHTNTTKFGTTLQEMLLSLGNITLAVLPPTPLLYKAKEFLSSKQNPPLKANLHPANLAKTATVFNIHVFFSFCLSDQGQIFLLGANQLCSDISVLAWRSLYSQTVLV